MTQQSLSVLCFATSSRVNSFDISSYWKLEDEMKNLVIS